MILINYNEFMREDYYDLSPMNRFKTATTNKEIVQNNVAYNIGDSMVYIWNPQNIMTKNFIAHRKYISAIYVESGEVEVEVAKITNLKTVNEYQDITDEEELSTNEYETYILKANEVLINGLEDGYRITQINGEFVIGRISKDGGVK